MKTLALAEGVSATAAAAQAAVRSRVTPFLAGRDVVATIAFSDATGTPTGKIQGSDDGTTWVDLMTSTVLGTKKATVKAREYMRFNVTAAGTAGVASAYIEAGA